MVNWIRVFIPLLKIGITTEGIALMFMSKYTYSAFIFALGFIAFMIGYFAPEE